MGAPYRGGGPSFVSHSLKVPSLVRGRTDLDVETHKKVHDLVHLVRPTKGSRLRELLPPGNWSTHGGDAERQLLLGPDLLLEPRTDALLQRVFASRCAYGDRLNTTLLSEAKWSRLLRDAGLLDGAERDGALAPITAADASVMFKKVGQAVGQAPRLRFSGFVKALQIVALRTSEGPFPALVEAALTPLAADLPAPHADPTAGATDGEAVQEFLGNQDHVVRQLFCYFSHQPESSVLQESRPTTPRVCRADVSGELKPGEAFSPGSSKTSTKVSVGAVAGEHARARRAHLRRVPSVPPRLGRAGARAADTGPRGVPRVGRRPRGPVRGGVRAGARPPRGAPVRLQSVHGALPHARGQSRGLLRARAPGERVRRAWLPARRRERLRAPRAAGLRRRASGALRPARLEPPGQPPGLARPGPGVPRHRRDGPQTGYSVLTVLCTVHR